MSVSTVTPKPKVKRRFVWLWYAVLAISLIGGAQQNSHDSSALLGGIFVCAILVGATEVLLYLTASSRAKQEAAKQSAQEAAHERTQAIIHELESKPLTPINVPGLVLQSGEECYLHTTAQVAAPHTTTRRVGGYGGFSVPTPIKGVRMNLGQYASTPVSRTSFVNEGPATVTLTNHRIIIAGQFGNRTYTLKSVVGVEPYSDGVKLDVANKKPVILISGDIRLGATIAKILNVHSN